MTRLFASEGPRVFAVAPGADFAATLAAGLRARLGDAPPEAMARIELTLNTRRARRAVEAALEAGGGGATFLPRIRALAEIGEDPLETPDIAPSIPPARRALYLTRLVEAFLGLRPDLGPLAAAPALAAALARLLDEMQREGVALAALDEAAPVEHAAHWETTLGFLAILRVEWPRILAQDEGGALDPQARARAAIAATLAGWEAAPPAHPVIAAGSTGSVATTAMMLRAVARLPQGAVVLPGFDPAQAAGIWDDIDDDHPYAGFRRLLDALGVAPADVPFWTDDAAPRAARRRLLGQALRPAPVTDQWLEAAPALRAESAEATGGLTLIEAPDARREAVAIALALRGALEAPGRRAALITPDRTLARRVAAALARWGIEPDDSGGRPLALTPPGVFLRLLADAGFGPFDAVGLLALLKHPLCGAGRDRAAHLAAVRRFEVRALRQPGIATLGDCRRAHAETVHPDHADVLGPVLDVLARLAEGGPRPLGALTRAHLDAAVALAGAALWDKEAGAKVEAAARAFAEAAPVYGLCAPPTYGALFAAGLAGEVREEAFRPDPRIAIWGPLEARMQSADLVILGGLNEGVWPDPPAPDPWLSRPMRKAIGLPAPERQLGLAAHDVLQAACAPEVILSRAAKIAGAPATQSRWLARLVTLLRGVDDAALERMRARGRVWTDLVDPLTRPARLRAPAVRPAPRPPVGARPRQLSATQVETLIRDPYAIYARKILNLRPLDPIGRDTDARDRGTALHDVLERFGELTRDPGADPGAAFAQAVQARLGQPDVPETLRRLWRARLARIAPVFLREEAARRALGAPAGFEAEGERRAGAQDFTLTARADRIDRRHDGTLAIYDYKTGAIPSDKQIGLFAKQMPLEAEIAASGGFAGISEAGVAELAHISLGGGKGAGAATAVKGDPGELAAEAWEGLLRLIAAYDDPRTGYPARARPRHIAYASDYDHLARFGEWEDGDEAGQ